MKKDGLTMEVRGGLAQWRYSFEFKKVAGFLGRGGTRLSSSVHYRTDSEYEIR